MGSEKEASKREVLSASSVVPHEVLRLVKRPTTIPCLCCCDIM